jgi:hypothetical protein
MKILNMSVSSVFRGLNQQLDVVPTCTRRCTIGARVLRSQRAAVGLRDTSAHSITRSLSSGLRRLFEVCRHRDRSFEAIGRTSKSWIKVAGGWNWQRRALDGAISTIDFLIQSWEDSVNSHRRREKVTDHSWTSNNQRTTIQFSRTVRFQYIAWNAHIDPLHNRTARAYRTNKNGATQSKKRHRRRDPSLVAAALVENERVHAIMKILAKTKDRSAEASACSHIHAP